MNLTRAELLQLFAVCLLSEKDRVALDADRFGHLKSLISNIVTEPKNALQSLLLDEGVSWDGTPKILPFLAENLAIESTAKHNEERLQKAMSYLAVASKVPNLRDDPIVAAEVKKAAETIAELLG